MSKDFYQRIDQKVYFQREVTYGSIYDPETEIAAWTIVPADHAQHTTSPDRRANLPGLSRILNLYMLSLILYYFRSIRQSLF